jgi:hypothetical protein
MEPNLDACMAFTEVFRTVRFEHGLTFIVGVLIGAAVSWLHDR